MKLQRIEHQETYRFSLTFADGRHREVDLQELIGQHVTLADVQTAHIDPEWGCLEFLNGQVDIETKTLYRYAGFAEERKDLPALQATRHETSEPFESYLAHAD